jgi:hypothetical protein
MQRGSVPAAPLARSASVPHSLTRGHDHPAIPLKTSRSIQWISNFQAFCSVELSFLFGGIYRGILSYAHAYVYLGTDEHRCNSILVQHFHTISNYPFDHRFCVIQSDTFTNCCGYMGVLSPDTNRTCNENEIDCRHLSGLAHDADEMKMKNAEK